MSHVIMCLSRPEEGIKSPRIVLCVVVSYLLWVLGKETRSSVRTARVLTNKLPLQPCFQFLGEFMTSISIICILTNEGCFIMCSTPNNWYKSHDFKPTAGTFQVWAYNHQTTSSWSALPALELYAFWKKNPIPFTFLNL